MQTHHFLTIAEWRALWLHDGRGAALLKGHVRQLAAAASTAPGTPGAAVWLHLATAAQLDVRSAELHALLAAAGDDTQALLRRHPLLGVPFAAKDNIDVAGMPTTAACPAFAYLATANGHAVQRLLDAGAVCIGKTNLDQFATGLVGTRSPYGRPANVFDATRVSGGSSSGSAVAVARGDVPFALGTDTAGSGRVPAGFNNIVGLKPTPGRVGTSGVVPACRTLDCVSVLALTVDDAAAVLAAIEGPDPADAYSSGLCAGPARLPERLRIGVPAAVQIDMPGYVAAWQQAQQAARALGHALVPLDFAPLHAVAGLLYDGPWVAERHAVVQPLLDSDPAALDPQVRHVVEQAARFSATDAFRAQYALRALAREIAPLWQQVDVLMVPTAPAHPTHAAIDADPLAGNARLGTYTNFVNLLGWCALAVPGGMCDAGGGTGLPLGLPFGVTFIAPADADAALARFGSQWQAALGLPPGASTRPLCDLAGAGLATPRSQSCLPLAVVGAHLSGMPLNGQLTARGATLRSATTTAPHYRLHALPGTVPPKPGLQRVATGGAAIAVEVWDVPLAAVGSLLALVPPPLGLGTLALADGSQVHGFICESHALVGATDITAFGGWRAYMATQRDDGKVADAPCPAPDFTTTLPSANSCRTRP